MSKDFLVLIALALKLPCVFNLFSLVLAFKEDGILMELRVEECFKSRFDDEEPIRVVLFVSEF